MSIDISAVRGHGGWEFSPEDLTVNMGNRTAGQVMRELEACGLDLKSFGTEAWAQWTLVDMQCACWTYLASSRPDEGLAGQGFEDDHLGRELHEVLAGCGGPIHVRKTGGATFIDCGRSPGRIRECVEGILALINWVGSNWGPDSFVQAT